MLFRSLYCTVLYCTVLYCTVLYCTVLYCTVLGYHDMIYSGVLQYQYVLILVFYSCSHYHTFFLTFILFCAYFIYANMESFSLIFQANDTLSHPLGTLHKTTQNHTLRTLIFSSTRILNHTVLNHSILSYFKFVLFYRILLSSSIT